jgi:histidine ammonia-lyase
MVILDGGPLAIEDVVDVARRRRPVALAESVRERMAATHRVVAALNEQDTAVYGITTGFGALADRAVGRADRRTLQRRVVLSHAAGMGSPLDAEVVRGMMLLRARTLAAGHSGVRVELPEALVRLLATELVPWVPAHGSLGASGDLAPLAHIAAALIGEGWLISERGDPQPAAPALASQGLGVLDLEPKEGLALINGTDGMAAMLALAVWDLDELLRTADCACAMSVEALLGTPRAFEDRVVRLRDAPGQRSSAANLRALLRESPIVASHRASHHAVQDAYSLRCAPQVHGAARDVVDFCRTVVERELASVVDNPVVLEGEVISAGNFHGQALAYAADHLAAVCADLAGISERRVDRLLDPARSRGLPAFLSGDPGLNSGLMIAQYTAAALVARLRAAATPFAVQSASTSAGQEDHVSMGWEAALRTRDSVAHLRRVLAIEAVAAAQALDLRQPLRPGPGTHALRASLRAGVPILTIDRMLEDDLRVAEEWLRSGMFRTAAQAAAGALR